MALLNDETIKKVERSMISDLAPMCQRIEYDYTIMRKNEKIKALEIALEEACKSIDCLCGDENEKTDPSTLILEATKKVEDEILSRYPIELFKCGLYFAGGVGAREYNLGATRAKELWEEREPEQLKVDDTPIKPYINPDTVYVLKSTDGYLAGKLEPHAGEWVKELTLAYKFSTSELEEAQEMADNFTKPVKIIKVKLVES